MRLILNSVQCGRAIFSETHRITHKHKRTSDDLSNKLSPAKYNKQQCKQGSVGLSGFSSSVSLTSIVCHFRQHLHAHFSYKAVNDSSDLIA
ncbi:adenylate kinase [Trichinella spiralis]|uniref:Uncharacterized protein n=2 Tax=Trichinella spiralis TaxID=6334 RepID=A0A0V1B731_TRISP|nr:hypothetical protein T01_6301 [Trichinella spiralis]